MADHYVLSAFAVQTPTAEEQVFMRAMVARAEAASDQEVQVRMDGLVTTEAGKTRFLTPFEVAVYEAPWGWDAEVGETTYFSSDESCNREAMVIGLQEFLLAFRPPGTPLSFTWAYTCSKPRPGAFGGGGVVLSTSAVKWFDIHDLVDKNLSLLDPPDPSEEKRRQFQDTYARHIMVSATAHPEEYDLRGQTPAEYGPVVASRIMEIMIERGPLSVNRNTPAFKSACKAVGVKNTNTELKKWFGLP